MLWHSWIFHNYLCSKLMSNEFLLWQVSSFLVHPKFQIYFQKIYFKVCENFEFSVQLFDKYCKILWNYIERICKNWFIMLNFLNSLLPRSYDKWAFKLRQIRCSNKFKATTKIRCTENSEIKSPWHKRKLMAVLRPCPAGHQLK